jgi:hypothetical protein
MSIEAFEELLRSKRPSAKLAKDFPESELSRLLLSASPA